MANDKTFIHPSAIIDDGAQIGDGTRIWHFCHLAATSKVGENCVVGQNVFIDNHTVIGNAVKIQNNVSIYNGVTVEDEVFLGPSMVFTNVINPRSFIERKHEFKKTQVCKGATIGANATVLCGIDIGRYAMIGAGAVVTKNVPAYALMTGNPARQTGWVSEAGLKLDFNADGIAVCPYSNKTYRLINGIIDPGQ